jgi:sugar porter (SP) family MFS transporter
MATDLAPPAADLHHAKGRQFRFFNIIMVVTMGLGSMTYGYAAGVIAISIAQPSFISYFGLDVRPDAPTIYGLMNSLYNAGGFVGTFAVSFFSDRWGRRVGIAFPAALIVVSGALGAGSVNIPMFLVFRFISGFGSYMIVSAVPIWTTEVAPPNVRGIFVNVHGAAILFGFAASNWFGYAFWTVGEWRAPIALQCFFPLALLSGLYWMPESPRWLLMNDRADEADRTLRKLHTPREAEVELVQIQRQMEIDRHLPSSYWSLLSKPSYRKRVLLGVFVTCSIQLTGPFVMNNFGPTIYASLGYDTKGQLLYQVGWITLAFGGGLISLVAIDLVTRPIIVGGGILACIIFLIIEAGLVANFASTPEQIAHASPGALRAAVAMMYIYVLFFEITVDGGQFVYLGEIFPTHIRAKGISLGMAGLCAMNIIWLQVAPIAFATIGWKFYLCFIIPGGIAGFVILFWFPDTRGLPLENIALIFGDKAELFGYESSEQTPNDIPGKQEPVVHMEAV